MNLTLSELSLVVLIGPSGAGKHNARGRVSPTKFLCHGNAGVEMSPGTGAAQEDGGWSIGHVARRRDCIGSHSYVRRRVL